MAPLPLSSPMNPTKFWMTRISTFTLTLDRTKMIPTHLENGAEILQLKSKADGNYIVLAHWPQSYHEYVTWTIDSELNAYWGHYFGTLEDAEQDFTERYI